MLHKSIYEPLNDEYQQQCVVRHFRLFDVDYVVNI
jgi:hypothetical protein